MINFGEVMEVIGWKRVRKEEEDKMKKKVKRARGTIETKSQSTDDRPKDGNDRREGTGLETLPVCAGDSVRPAHPSSPKSTSSPPLENCSTDVGAAGKVIQTDNEECEDLLGYCRAWNVQTVDQFWQKWIGHPKKRARLDIFDELASY